MSRKKPGQRNNLGYYIKEGVSSIFTHGFMSFASVVIIIACLVIMGSFFLVAINVNDMVEEAERRNQVLAFVDETLSEEEARALESQVLATENVYGATFVTRDEAHQAFVERHEGAELEDIDSEVFRHRFVVDLDDIAYMQDTQSRLLTIPGIVVVDGDTHVARIFVAIRNMVAVVFIVIVGVLFVISVFIISNTIKLATFDRREEIAIMRMVGATNWFIRWPFLFQGFILGLTGAAIAFAIQWGLYGTMANQIMGLTGGQLLSVASFGEVADFMIAIFMGTGFVVGTLGSAIAIRNYLKV